MANQTQAHGNTVISQKLFRWAIGYLHHQIPLTKALVPYGLSRVVNYAFACELLIKSHLTREIGPAKGHELADLFGNLDSTTRDTVVDLVKQHFPDKIYNTETFDFYTVLNEQTAVFAEWRYPYDLSYSTPLENKRGHYGFLFAMARALIDAYITNYSEIPGYNGEIPIPSLEHIDTFYTLD